MTPKQILLVGYGFLGKEIHRQIKAKNAKSRIFTISKSAKNYTCQEHLTADIADKNSIARNLSKIANLKFDVVIIAVSTTSERRKPPLQKNKNVCIDRLQLYRRIYLQGTRNIMEFCKSDFFVFCSSTSVYGHKNCEWVTEESQTSPPAETGKILLEVEKEVLQNENVNGCVVRLAGLYGYDRSYILNNIKKNRVKMEEKFVNQIHVSDSAKAILHLCEHKEKAQRQIFNVADSSPILQTEIFTKLANGNKFEFDLPEISSPDFNKNRGWSNKKISSKKLQKTGWQPQYKNFFQALYEGAVYCKQ